MKYNNSISLCLNGGVWGKHGYEPLDVPSDRPFTLMEIGVGVGAWMRTFLRAFPLSKGVGIDYEQSAIDVANVVLPASQIKLQQLNMFSVPETFKDRQFDYLFIPGTLCYAESFTKLAGLIEGIITSRVIKSGGKMSVTMISYSGSNTGSCITGVEKEYWSSVPGWKVIEIQDMDDWKLPHSYGRYAVYLQADY
jgi:ubiquinone/menaquinone biosynthesis C-methylase UbiE